MEEMVETDKFCKSKGDSALLDLLFGGEVGIGSNFWSWELGSISFLLEAWLSKPNSR